MNGPLRCPSSIATTYVLQNFRNPQGEESNWINQEEARGNLFVFISKALATEVAVSVLCVSAAVESVAYGILIAGSLPLCLVTFRPIKFSAALFTSSIFTTFWNFGNVFVFNPFYTNLVTNESFARFSIDHWPRGRVFTAACDSMLLALITLCIFDRSHSYVYIPSSSIALFSEISYSRDEDLLYIADWCREHHLQVPDAAADIDQRVMQIILQGRATNNLIDQAKAFFKNNILNDGKVYEATRNEINKILADHRAPEATRNEINNILTNRRIDEAVRNEINNILINRRVDEAVRNEIKNILTDLESILDSDAEAMVFAITRLLYICAFEQRAQSTEFFKPSVRNIISRLRELPMAEGEHLKPHMNNLKGFNAELHDRNLLNLMNSLKEGAYKELQGESIILRCYQEACNEYIADHPRAVNQA